MRRLWIKFVTLLLLGLIIGSVSCDSEKTEPTTSPTLTPFSTPTPAATPTLTPTYQNQQPIETISVLGPLQPINPGGPNVEIALKNVSNDPVVSLTATLELNRSFNFNFDISLANPLLPNNSISAKLTLINGGFSDSVSYPLKISGAFQSGGTFVYTVQVEITEPPPNK